MALTKVTSDGITDGTIIGTDLATNVDLVDNQKIRFGTGNDLQIYHDGTNNIINDAGSTKIKIQRGGSDVWELKSTGLQGVDNQKLMLGTSDDLQIYHDGSNSYILNAVGSGQLTISSDNALNLASRTGTEYFFRAYTNGGAELYYDNSKKFETLSTGVRAQGGICFGSDTAAANHLDDYEEGTFTPAISGVTYNQVIGRYTKVGRKVFTFISINGSNTTASGNIRITGLPFTTPNIAGEYYGANSIPMFEVSGISLDSGKIAIYGRIERNTSNVQLLCTEGSSHGISGFSLQSNHTIRTSFTYEAA